MSLILVHWDHGKIMRLLFPDIEHDVPDERIMYVMDLCKHVIFAHRSPPA